MTLPPPGDGRAGSVARILETLKGLTFTNALVIICLGLALGPAYLAWRVINDQALLAKIFSSYEERLIPGTDCGMRVASVPGGRPSYYISMSYAFSGNDRWYLGVNTPVEPNEPDAINYCRTLGAIGDYARNPGSAPNPTFPYSKRHIFPMPGGAQTP